MRGLLIWLITLSFLLTNQENFAQRQLQIDGNATSTELVEFNAETIDLGFDVLQLRLPGNAGPDDGDFLECNLGNIAQVAKIRADGSAVFKSVEYDDGTVQESAKGLPIAFGFINNDGSTNVSYGSFTSTWNAVQSRYDIDITGENYLFTDYITVVTPTGVRITPRVSSGGGELLVYLYNSAGSLVQGSFQFVTFKP